ncbi:MAG: ribonuclease H-like domain-containing protein [Candidatus Caldatribacteriota bacterium]|nr:ribonuclease H-like domain-containing protein [Candidatus Caldatribacteriota bacterium]
MDNRERLEKIFELQKSINKITSSSKTYNQKAKKVEEVKIEEVLSGNFIKTPFGLTFVWENCFSHDYKCGEITLSQIFKSPTRSLSLLVGDKRIDRMDINKTVFLDTETTGLAGGAGTFIFLIGLGYFTEAQFCVRQYFMRDFDEEQALLSALNELLDKFESVVTYNGKSFDLPLMENRFIMSEMKMNLEEPTHLDLLYPARRLWKKRLENCSLSTVERDVLGLYRENDVPGYLVPEIYFNYLRTKDARALKGVFEHNLQDILSLVALAAKMGDFLEEPLKNTIYPSDIYSLGKIYDKQKEYIKSALYYKEALKRNLAEEEALEILRLVSFAYKRQEKWEEAEKIWKEIIERSQEFIYYPYEELAKYYEHYLKDYRKAKLIVEEALNIVENIFLKEKLKYRLKRIKRKEKSGK